STSCLVCEREGGHRPELARQLSETEVDLIVAGVSGSGEEVSRFDAEQERLHLARDERDGHRLLLVSKPNAVIGADCDRQRKELSLLRRRRDRTGNRADGRPAG